MIQFSKSYIGFIYRILEEEEVLLESISSPVDYFKENFKFLSEDMIYKESLVSLVRKGLLLCQKFFRKKIWIL